MAEIFFFLVRGLGVLLLVYVCAALVMPVLWLITPNKPPGKPSAGP